MKLTLVAALIFVFATASADAPPAAPAAHKVAEFDSMNEAAVRALQYVSRVSTAYEFGGVIAELADGKFAIGEPDTFYRGDATNIDEDPLAYDGKIVATYHTHPCLPASHMPNYFSPEDLHSARVTGHVAYMGDLCTGDVHRWRPGVDGYEKPEGANALQLLLSPPMSKGQIVGQIHIGPVTLENTQPGAP